ncbi:fumarylacetoacetate hydrolase family protein [Canibacter zhoujuaniae]|uniref:fumarylacetoacetate hydrolase family protein n=1 Tax=Canibacter zhoujuaniae TaxID=2708343 RepID=UPI00141E9A59|nr:fumarylacetoacetate hydrolase family protein [Canibacter zhoujuaniae]
MKIVRFSKEQKIAFGVVDEAENGDLEVVELAGDPLGGKFETTGTRYGFGQIRVLSPVVPMSKVIGVGKNYVAHQQEMQDITGATSASGAFEPLLFLKPNTSVIGPGDPIVLPQVSSNVQVEAELAVVIGAVGKHVPEEKALDIVFGYTVANDVSARDLQVADGQWARAKGFDTFCPLGPVIETEFNSDAARVKSRINGEIRQDAPVHDMIHSVAKLVSYASSVFTLVPGDVILTGTPAGVSTITDGDSVEVEVSGIGVLRNPVISETKLYK